MAKSRKKSPLVPSPADIEVVLRQFSNAPTSVRNRALVALTWRCALRASEALGLIPGDVELQRGTVALRKTKGGKSRTVFADAGSLALLKEWLAIRDTLKVGRKDPIFCTLDGEPVKDAYFRAMLARKAKDAGFVERWHPHALRHARAVELARSKVSPAVIQKVLGHGDLRVTTEYLAGLGDEDVAEGMRSDWTLSA